jgi:N-acetylglucosamine-6-phosphate deacetylase
LRRQKIIGREPSTGRCIEVTVENDIVISIEESAEPCLLWISAGLIDLQVNGYAGHDLNGADIVPATVAVLARALLATGVTTFAPTVITAPEEEMVHRLRTIAEGCSSDTVAAGCIPFIHVEGPHISPLDGFRGAHPKDCVRPPSLAEFERWQAACGGMVGLVTLSPHFAGSNEYIAALVSRGVHVSIGHTHASQRQIQQAVDSGARLSTHLGNGIAPLLDRHPNPIWSQLADDRLTASFIADGHHLPAETLKAMVKAKGLRQSILVSDAVALAGMPAGSYTAPVGGRVNLSAEGRLSMEGTSTLAGAVMALSECIGLAVTMTSRSLAEVLIMATSNPGRFAGNRGVLQVGARADLFRFRWGEQVEVVDVWLAGQLMYQAS